MKMDLIEVLVAIKTKQENELAKSTFNVYQNKELHNFPTPEKEVPEMIKQLLNKLE